MSKNNSLVAVKYAKKGRKKDQLENTSNKKETEI